CHGEWIARIKLKQLLRIVHTLCAITGSQVIPNQKFKSISSQAGVRCKVKKFFHPVNPCSYHGLSDSISVRVEAACICRLGAANASEHKSTEYKRSDRPRDVVKQRTRWWRAVQAHGRAVTSKKPPLKH